MYKHFRKSYLRLSLIRLHRLCIPGTDSLSPAQSKPLFSKIRTNPTTHLDTPDSNSDNFRHACPNHKFQLKKQKTQGNVKEYEKFKTIWYFESLPRVTQGNNELKIKVTCLWLPRTPFAGSKLTLETCMNYVVYPRMLFFILNVMHLS